jgi:hypothetical protein
MILPNCEEKEHLAEIKSHMKIAACEGAMLTLTAEKGVNESQGASAKAAVEPASRGGCVWPDALRGLH